MSFKFEVGEVVYFAPKGERKSGFTVVRQMPEQPGVEQRSYRIKSVADAFERNVLESELAKSA